LLAVGGLTAGGSRKSIRGGQHRGRDYEEMIESTLEKILASIHSERIQGVRSCWFGRVLVEFLLHSAPRQTGAQCAVNHSTISSHNKDQQAKL
jgi:hypothetical protein